MKRMTVLLLLVIFALSGCKQSKSIQSHSSISNAKNISFYESFLDTMKNDQADLYYYMKDIDGDRVDDLLILENTKLSVYTYSHSVKLIGEHDFLTGTVRFFHSDKNTFPGIFYFTVGGGANHYGYMTIQDEKLFFEDLWEENYAVGSQNGVNCIKEVSSDKQLISESKVLFSKNCDIKFAALKK